MAGNAGIAVLREMRQPVGRRPMGAPRMGGLGGDLSSTSLPGGVEVGRELLALGLWSSVEDSTERPPPPRGARDRAW